MTEHTHTAHSVIVSTESGEHMISKRRYHEGQGMKQIILLSTFFPKEFDLVFLLLLFFVLFSFIYLLLFRLLKLYFHLSLIMFPENSDAFKQINNFISIVSVGIGNNKITLFPGSTCALQKWDKQKMT